MLEGKVALVTGSTDGIGFAVARVLAREKADIVMNGFGDPAVVQARREEIEREFGVRVLHVPANLTIPAEAVQLVHAAQEAFGHVDILVNNAGTQHKSPVEEQPPERWDEVLALNLSAPFHTIRTALPAMRTRGWGRIVNVASIYGLTGGYNRSSYVASKHGLVGLTKAVALETANSAVTCNAVCPGDVSTRIFYKTAKDLALRENISREEAITRVAASNMPSGRAISPEQVAELVGYLCSPAAAEIRGAAMSIDGGWLAR